MIIRSVSKRSSLRNVKLLPHHNGNARKVSDLPFTCAAYYPFEVIALDHIGPLVIDEKGHQYVLVIIDAFSRWVELYPTKGVTADETAKCIFQHLGRFGAPERILTDRGTAFYNELVSELLHMCRAQHELTIAYSKEENAIVERTNQEVIRHLRALLFDKRVYNYLQSNVL